MTTRVLLVDDHPAVRDGLFHQIESHDDMQVCGQACSVREALQLVREVQPDVAVLDIALKESDGLEFARLLHTRRSPIRVVFYSMFDEDVYAERCLSIGAMGYVSKQSSPEEVVLAIRDAMAGNVYLSRKVQNILVARKGQGLDADPVQRLTDRQLEIFRLIGEGKATNDIAKQLHLSLHTIETHRENIKKKLGISSAPELIRKAVLWSNGRNESHIGVIVPAPGTLNRTMVNEDRSSKTV